MGAMAVVHPSRSGEIADPPAWERLAAGFVLFMLTGALLAPVLAPDQSETPILRLTWLPVYALTAGLMALRFERIIKAWPAWLLAGLLLALAFASKYWSIDPEVTQRRVIAMAINAAFALYLGAVFRDGALPRLLMQTCLVMAVGSVIMVFAYPQIGVHQADNAGMWRGLWYEKNQMGLVMVVGAVSAAACLAADDRRPWTALAAFGLCSLLVLASQSKTSLLCLLLGSGFVGGLWALRRGGAVLTVAGLWGGVLLAGGAAWVWFVDSAAVLTALGKDPSLTGRTLIWESLMRRVAERPWTGYGFSAFWGRDSVPAAFVRQETAWPVPSAHNGWIDLLVQLGWPGAVAVGVVIAVAVVLVVLRLDGMGAREGYWSGAYLAVFLLLSLSESVLLNHASLPWTLMLAILSRAVIFDAPQKSAALAPAPSEAYGNRLRIASDYVNGPARRRPVRLL